MRQKRIDVATKRKIALDYLNSDLTQIQIAVKHKISLLTLQRILKAYKEKKLNVNKHK
jgi:DNA-binding transcriptional regulator LsrR (DeoR family)